MAIAAAVITTAVSAIFVAVATAIAALTAATVIGATADASIPGGGVAAKKALKETAMTVRSFILRTLPLSAIAMLAACASHESARLSSPAIGYASGSRFAGDLAARDEAALARAFDAAMETGAAGEAKDWSSGP
ncbi:MAG TPA: hypothetical protein VNH64_06820, partial [Parvularculaceae bacterium]|nr:hypothetical protein [Parvularculaceae bacterium]